MALHDTRQRIIEYLKEKGQATVEELAEFVQLTPMAVRYHLNVLQRDNLIAASTVRQSAGRGRPQQVYALTQAADDLFPVDYYSLTDYLLAELSRRLGDDGIDELFASIAARLAREAPALREGQTVEARLDEIKLFLENKGFVIDWEDSDDSYRIHAYSCPYRQVAQEHEQVCLLDERVIGTMLNTTPRRIACLNKGDGHCTYEVSKSIELIMNPLGT